MTKSDVTKFIKTIGRTMSKRSPEILTGVGIAGMCTTVVLAVKATPKALKLIEDEKNRQNYELCKESRDSGHKNCKQIAKLQPIEVVKVAWKPYVPATLTGMASVACIIGASSVNARRNAALYSAYKLSETALTEFKDKAVDVVGEEKVKEIKQKIAEDTVEKATAPDSKTKVIISSDGDTWFIDPFSNTQFRSTTSKIDAAVNRVNKNLMVDMFASLSDLYDELGVPELEHTMSSDHIGWCIDDGIIETDYSDAIVKDGKAYVVMDFLKRPDYGFDDKQKLYG